MARARNIKPGFYKNEDLAECSAWARLIFPGLWMLADREGRMEDRPKRIKGELLPYDSIDIDPLLDELAQWGFILRYQVEGERFIQVLKFNEHQAPHVREAASTIPAPAAPTQSTVQAPDKPDASTNLGKCEASPRSPDSLNPSSLNPSSLNPESLFADSGILNPDEKTNVEGKPPTVDRRAPPPKDDALEIFEYWQLKTGHKQAKLDAKRVKTIKARLKDGYTVGQICLAVDGCLLSPHHMGQNDTRTIYDDIELICRDGPRVDKFIALAERGQQTIRPANTQGTFDTLQRYMGAQGEN